MFGFADHAALPAPTLVGAIGEVFEDPRGLLGLREQFLRRLAFLAQNLQQTLVFRQSEQEVDAVAFAPTHQVIATEAAVAADHDLHLRPMVT